MLVTGTVYSIDKTILFGDPYINFQTGYVADGVVAYFDSSSKSQLTNIKQGQTIRVLGTCGGRSWLGYTTLNACTIVN